MKTYLKPFMMLLLSSTVLFTACEEESVDVNENPDPRTLVLGDYKMSNFQVHVYGGSYAVDTTVTVTSKPVITVKADKNIDQDELRIDLREFLEEAMIKSVTEIDVYSSLQSEKIDVDDPDETIAERVTGREYKIKDFDFDWKLSDGTTSGIYACDFNGEGKFDKGELDLRFVIKIKFGEILTFEGTAIGKK